MGRELIQHDEGVTVNRTEKLGLGLAALGRPAYLTAGRNTDLGVARSVEKMRALTAEVLSTAYDGGIRYVDVARSYGLAEEFLADWLKSRTEATTDVVVASKWGYRYVGDWRSEADLHEVKDHTLEAFTTQLRESTALLGDRLNLYQVHSVTEDSPVLSDARLQHALADLRDDGMPLGFSTSGPRQAATIRAGVELRVGGAPLFSSVQSTWNILETSSGAALSEAHSAGLAVVIKECFANGRLAPGTDDPAPGVRMAAQFAADTHVGLDQVAIAAVVHQPWASRALSGAVTTAQLKSHIAGACIELPSEALAELTANAENPDEYWESRSHRPWS